MKLGRLSSRKAAPVTGSTQVSLLELFGQQAEKTADATATVASHMYMCHTYFPYVVGPRGRPAAPTRGSVVNTLPGPGRVALG
eukprot:scaffold4735_cov116-Isochrysis_galbana.AAC.1